MEELLREALLANTALTALVGQRVTWLDRPQGSALPAVTLQIAAGARSYTMSGPVGLIAFVIQVDVWGGTYKSMKQVSRALIDALHSLKTAPLQAFIDSESETSERQDGPDATSSTTFYRTRLDCRVWFTPPA